MEQAIALIFIMQIVQSICLFGVFIEIGKTLKELEKDAVQVNNQDV